MASSRKRGDSTWKRPGLLKSSTKVQVVEAPLDASGNAKRVAVVKATKRVDQVEHSDVEDSAGSIPRPSAVTDLAADDASADGRVLAVTPTPSAATMNGKAAKTAPPSKTSKSKVAHQKQAPSSGEQEGKGGSAAADGKSKKKRMYYRAKENCLVMQEVIGDEGIFNRDENESKADCWIKITARLQDVLGMQISPDSLRKHIDTLEKAYKKEQNADRARSGKEKKLSTEEQELESLMNQYVGLKDNEDSEKAERAENRSKKDQEDRIGGAAIRKAALTTERPHKKKSSQKRVDPLAFLKELNSSLKAERVEERRERLEHESQVQLQHAALAEKQTEMMLQMVKIFASVMPKPTQSPPSEDSIE